MTPEEKAIARLDDVRRRLKGDPEQAHGDADEILVDLIREAFPKVAKAWDFCHEMTGPWWYA